MDRFFSDQNIDRLRKLRTGTASERTALLALLDREEARFIEEQRARSRCSSASSVQRNDNTYAASATPRTA